MRTRKQYPLSLIYRKLHSDFGPQDWWPAKTPFEVIVGAILTQNTNWSNVEKALTNLKNRRLLSPQALNRLSHKRLASLIRPAGYFNIKAKRLKNFLRFFIREYNGQIKTMGKEETPLLREKLLSVNGIGPETADSILLYAFERPVFVVDAYTKRIFSRHKIVEEKNAYYQIQDVFEKGLRKNVKMFNEYHALIVRLAKEFCRSKANCQGCPLDFLNTDRRYRSFRYASRT